MFRQLPDEVFECVLRLFNLVWKEGKPGKDPDYAGNYRPIALTSDLCKSKKWLFTDCRTIWNKEGC